MGTVLIISIALLGWLAVCAILVGACVAARQGDDAMLSAAPSDARDPRRQMTRALRVVQPDAGDRCVSDEPIDLLDHVVVELTPTA